MSKRSATRIEANARRMSLVAAAARVLAREGAAGVSVRNIAVEAGVSPGLVTHHFGGVEAMIAATYSEIGAEVAAALDAAVANAVASPRARLEAYVLASFDPPIADPALLRTWIAFWSQVGTRPDISRLHAGIYGRYRARLEELLADAGIPAANVRRESITLTALVDGLWLELCLGPDTFDAAEAKDITRRQIEIAISATAS